MKLEGIAAFVAIAEAGSISEAARRLRLSKSVVSERLADLEKALRAALIHRTTRKLALTEAGSAFLVRASRIMHEVEDAAADLADRQGTLSGPLRLSAPVTFGRLHLGPALYSFLALHPELEVTLDLDDRRIDAASGGYDAVIRVGRISDQRFVAWRLAPNRRLLVAAPGYLAEHGTPAAAGELSAHRGIFYTNRGVADWHFAGAQGGPATQARMRLRVNNGDLMLDAAIAGLGIAMLPAFIASAAIAAGALRRIGIDTPAEEEFVYMAHLEGRQASSKLRALASHLRAAFGSPPYWEKTIEDRANTDD